jgi:hypothetical protein
LIPNGLVMEFFIMFWKVIVDDYFNIIRTSI